ncbi:hypothetical protein [Pseudooceanicola aestuarii]|uniref:hypothetical protein n=1 Tax=Pseudooceanicola aestuarii TaxID=2697319 RepID=UPI0013D67918|nr:hypothetical protein [Pseudooceanicola aestuarii]
MDNAEKKREQRRRWKAAGWREIRVRVAAEHANEVKAFAASLPAPRSKSNPNQQILPIEGL